MTLEDEVAQLKGGDTQLEGEIAQLKAKVVHDTSNLTADALAIS